MQHESRPLSIEVRRSLATLCGPGSNPIEDMDVSSPCDAPIRSNDGPPTECSLVAIKFGNPPAEACAASAEPLEKERCNMNREKL